MPSKRLLVSLHDVSPRHMSRLRTIANLLDEQGLRGRYSLLVVPDFWGAWPLRDHPDFCDWLKSRADEGAEIILHGYYHKDTAHHKTVSDRIRATYMTAREGEFLGLDKEQAVGLLLKGREVLEQVLGEPVPGFIAPAWLYGPGARAALAELGFAFAEDHWSVWAPASGQILSRSPVISYASRSRWRAMTSIAWSRVAVHALRLAETVRVAIHPADFDLPGLIAEVKRVIDILSRDRTPAAYNDLLLAANLPAPDFSSMRH